MNLASTSLHRWQYPVDDEGGLAGTVPSVSQKKVDLACGHLGIAPAHFLPGT